MKCLCWAGLFFQWFWALTVNLAMCEWHAGLHYYSGEVFTRLEILALMIFVRKKGEKYATVVCYKYSSNQLQCTI